MKTIIVKLECLAENKEEKVKSMIKIVQTLKESGFLINGNRTNEDFTVEFYVTEQTEFALTPTQVRI